MGSDSWPLALIQCGNTAAAEKGYGLTAGLVFISGRSSDLAADTAAQQAEPETLKPSSGTAAQLWEDAVEAPLVSVTAMLEGAQWSFSASVVDGRQGESGAEVSSASLLCSVLRVTGMDLDLRHRETDQSRQTVNYHLCCISKMSDFLMI